MISQQIRSSASLLDSIDAIRNWRAVLVLLGTFVAAGVVLAIGGLPGRVSWALLALFALLAWAVAFYGANAAGMMIMDEASGRASRPAVTAIMDSLATSHRLILVFLLLGAIYLAGFVVLALVLLLCKIPVLGPMLYAVVFPLSVVVSGIAMFALPTVVFPLSAPAVWSGATTLACVSQLLAIARKRLLLVLLLTVAVAFIAGVVAFLIGAVLLGGTAVTAMASVPILGMGGLGGFGSLLGGLPMGEMGDGPGMRGMGGAAGYAIAAGIGGGILLAIAATLPAMVYLRGACAVYLRAVDGLDLAAEQAAIDAKLAAAAARAREVQARAEAKARRDTPPPGPATQPAPEAATPVAAPAPAAMKLQCPKCNAPVAAGDAFCGECGHKLA